MGVYSMREVGDRQHVVSHQFDIESRVRDGVLAYRAQIICKQPETTLAGSLGQRRVEGRTTTAELRDCYFSCVQKVHQLWVGKLRRCPSAMHIVLFGSAFRTITDHFSIHPHSRSLQFRMFRICLPFTYRDYSITSRGQPMTGG